MKNDSITRNQLNQVERGKIWEAIIQNKQRFSDIPPGKAAEILTEELGFTITTCNVTNVYKSLQLKTTYVSENSPFKSVWNKLNPACEQVEQHESRIRRLEEQIARLNHQQVNTSQRLVPLENTKVF